MELTSNIRARKGHPWIGRRVRKFFPEVSMEPFDGIIERHAPAGKMEDEPALFHVVYSG